MVFIKCYCPYCGGPMHESYDIDDSLRCICSKCGYSYSNESDED